MSSSLFFLPPLLRSRPLIRELRFDSVRVPGGLKPFCSGRKHQNACCKHPRDPAAPCSRIFSFVENTRTAGRSEERLLAAFTALQRVTPWLENHLAHRIRFYVCQRHLLVIGGSTPAPLRTMVPITARCGPCHCSRCF